MESIAERGTFASATTPLPRAARSFLTDKAAILATLQESGIEISDVRHVFKLASDWSRRLLSETEGDRFAGSG